MARVRIFGFLDYYKQIECLIERITNIPDYEKKNFSASNDRFGLVDCKLYGK